MSGKSDERAVLTDTRKRTAATESHSDVYERTILFTNRYDGEALMPLLQRA